MRGVFAIMKCLVQDDHSEDVCQKYKKRKVNKPAHLGKTSLEEIKLTFKHNHNYTMSIYILFHSIVSGYSKCYLARCHLLNELDRSPDMTIWKIYSEW